jgi:hypothetical protein
MDQKLLQKIADAVQRTAGGVNIKNVTGADVNAAGAAYATGDLVGGKITISDVLNNDGQDGFVYSIADQDKSNQKVALDIVLFNEDPTETTFTDNAAIAIHADDLNKVIGVISVLAADYCAFASNAVATKVLNNLPFRSSSTNKIYACVVSRGAPTYVAEELSFSLGILKMQ